MGTSPEGSFESEMQRFMQVRYMSLILSYAVPAIMVACSTLVCIHVSYNQPLPPIGLPTPEA